MEVLTTTDLKKKLIRGEETWDGLVPHLCVVDKNQEGYLRSEGLKPHTSSRAQGSNARKVSPHNFWLQNQGRLSQCRRLLEP